MACRNNRPFTATEIYPRHKAVAVPIGGVHRVGTGATTPLRSSWSVAGSSPSSTSTPWSEDIILASLHCHTIAACSSSSKSCTPDAPWPGPWPCPNRCSLFVNVRCCHLDFRARRESEVFVGFGPHPATHAAYPHWQWLRRTAASIFTDNGSDCGRAVRRLRLVAAVHVSILGVLPRPIWAVFRRLAHTRAGSVRLG